MSKINLIKTVSFLIISIAFMTMTACKTRQVITQPLKEQGPEYLFEQMKKSELKYSTFSARFGAEAVVDQNNTSFSGAIYIVRDSLIWMSVSKFGLEVARFLITPDSAKMLNRINDSYFIGDFNYVCGLFQVDFDFDILQALITGNDFSYYDNDVFKASVENKSYKLSTIGRRKLKKYVIKENEAQRVLIQDILLDPENFKITKISIKEVKQENRKFESFYSDFRLLENQLTPYSLKVEITDDKKRIDVSVSFTKISLNTKENASFKIPADFKRVEK